MDEEFKNLLKNWKQCFSQSKQRHYYFNPKSGESLWTLEEVEHRILKYLKNKNQTSTINDDVIMTDSVEYDDYGTDAMDVEIAADIQNFRNDLCLTKSDSNNLIQIPNEEEFDSNFEIQLILILDTNIFISHLEKLKDLSTLDPPKFVFYVPWVVVQELDNLKIKKSIEQYININQKAKEAIKFIHALLDAKKSNFFFENFNKSNILIDGFILKSNDDKILNTALRISKENSKKRCILVTNDLNLMNKSKICNIEAFNFKTLKSNLINEKFEKKSPPLIKDNFFSAQKELVFDPLFEKFANSLASIIEDRLICSSTTVLSIFFEIEMIKAYDDLWLDLLLHKPPWTLTTLIVSLNKVFNALFGFTQTSKSYTYKQAFAELKASIEDYNAINMSNKNNHLERISCSLKMSENLLTFIKNFEYYGLDEKLSLPVTILEKNHFIGYNICQTLKCADLLLANFESEEESSCSENLKYIEVIWDQFRSLSLLTIDFFQNADSKKSIQTDVFFGIQYSITHESIRDLNQFYESCLNDCTKKNLRRFSKAIYVLYKILQLNKDSNIELQTNIELDECKQILSTVKSFFTNLDLRERMINVFWQFKEFENRFSLINHDDFLTIVQFQK